MINLEVFQRFEASCQQTARSRQLELQQGTTTLTWQYENLPDDWGYYNMAAADIFSPSVCQRIPTIPSDNRQQQQFTGAASLHSFNNQTKLFFYVTCILTLYGFFFFKE